MRITFLGGADEVGASCILLEWAGKRILVDAVVE
jgi:predicted metal-dependent RNase